MNYFYVGQVISDLNAIRLFIEDRLDELSPVISDEEKLADVRLIMSELLINGATHGNEFQVEKKVSLKIEIKSNNLIMRVWDEGQGFSLQIQEYDPTVLQRGGRGLVLIAGLAEELKCDRNRVYVKIIL